MKFTKYIKIQFKFWLHPEAGDFTGYSWCEGTIIVYYSDGDSNSISTGKLYFCNVEKTLDLLFKDGKK